MAVEQVVTGISAVGNATSSILGAFGSLPGVSALIKITQVAGVLFIAYLVFLIIRGIMQIRYAFSMKKLIENVEQINHKMDKLINARRGKK